MKEKKKNMHKKKRGYIYRGVVTQHQYHVYREREKERKRENGGDVRGDVRYG